MPPKIMGIESWLRQNPLLYKVLEYVFGILTILFIAFTYRLYNSDAEWWITSISFISVLLSMFCALYLNLRNPYA